MNFILEFYSDTNTPVQKPAYAKRFVQVGTSDFFKTSLFVKTPEDESIDRSVRRHIRP
ncbi:MAG: hypothetical protein ACHQK8_03355 [Bacteroidia bacterium]